MVETVGLAGKAPAKSYATATATDLSSDNGQRRACLPSAIPADSRLKKLWQAISKAEKSVTLFDLDLGTVPVINKETLSRKVTILLHEKAKSFGIYKGNQDAVSKSIDAILSWASIDFLGKGFKPFYNIKDANDDWNSKICTLPVKLTCKVKETRF